MIRKAKLEDTDNIKKLILEFHEESLGEYGISFDWFTIERTILNHISNHVVLIAEEDNKIIGLISGLISRSIFNSDQIIGQETMWYITKNERKGTTGIKLLKEFEKECKERGASVIMMIYMQNLMPKILDKFYRTQNYKRMEIQFIKEI